MKLKTLRLYNFQSFGADAEPIDLAGVTFMVGPNGAGKTAVLQALARMFAFDPNLRRVQRSDFHITPEDQAKEKKGTIEIWMEADFEFAELKAKNGKHPTIPTNFAHMRLPSKDGIPRVRIRLDASMDADGYIEEALNYVLEVDEDGQPVKRAPVSRHDRNTIHVHYLPARRDPGDHISYAANSLLGRTLRAADWQAERQSIATLTAKISSALADNEAVTGIGEQLSSHWNALHKGKYYADPTVSFARNEIEGLLRHLTVGFSPGHEDHLVDFARLSDGQKSLLYLSLVLSVQNIGRQVLAGKLKTFDIDRLRPALFTLIAMEEPENSLSPHYLGRVVKALTDFSAHFDAQAIVATHAPSLLKRVAPERVRYLRLDENRESVVKTIPMPDKKDEAYKFVREAVQAFPELYFSRLVVLGEGDSEEIVVPRLLQAFGLAEDDSSISVAPLGGRHVNHFWRLLHGLGIPQVTLLDLDLGRHQGGWGRVRYAITQLLKFPTIESDLAHSHLANFPKWNADVSVLTSKDGKDWIKFLESAGVFFSSPLDLDFAMLRRFSEAYGVEDSELEEPDDDVIAAVLGKSHGDVDQYSEERQKYFAAYHKQFKLGSKPAAHLGALSELDDETLRAKAPPSIARMIAAVKTKLDALPG